MNSKSLAKGNVKSLRISEKVKTAILGQDYELSLVFCTNPLSRKLNRIYRGKDKPTNVLAFPLSKTSGEIFINTDHLDGFSPLYLLIHGLLHLKGMRHGAKMNSEEHRFFNLFNGQTNISRDRHRKHPHQ